MKFQSGTFRFVIGSLLISTLGGTSFAASGDLTLQQAQERVLSSSLLLAAAHDQFQIAQDQTAIDHKGFAPTGLMNLTVGEIQSHSLGTSNIGTNSIAINWNFFNPKLSDVVTADKDFAESEEANYEVQRKQALLVVSLDFIAVLEDGEIKAAQQDRFNNATAYLSRVEDLTKEGKAAPVDLDQAKAELAKSTTALRTSQIGFNKDCRALLALLQLQDQPDQCNHLAPVAMPAIPNYDLDGSVQAALKNRPEITQLQKLADAAQAPVDTYSSFWRTNLSLGATISNSNSGLTGSNGTSGDPAGFDGLSPASDGNVRRGNIGFTLTFDPARRQKLGQAQHKETLAIHQLELAKITVRQQVGDIIDTAQNSVDLYNQAMQEWRTTKSVLDITDDQVKSGAVPPLSINYVTYMDNKTQGLIDWKTAYYNVAVASIQYQIAIGQDP